MNAEPKIPAQPSFLLLVPVLYDAAFYHLSYYSVSKLGLLYSVDQLRAMKEDMVCRTPAILAEDTRRYEVNAAGMMTGNGCRSSVFRWTQAALKNQLSFPLPFRQSIRAATGPICWSHCQQVFYFPYA